MKPPAEHASESTLECIPACHSSAYKATIVFSQSLLYKAEFTEPPTGSPQYSEVATVEHTPIIVRSGLSWWVHSPAVRSTKRSSLPNDLHFILPYNSLVTVDDTEVVAEDVPVDDCELDSVVETVELTEDETEVDIVSDADEDTDELSVEDTVEDAEVAIDEVCEVVAEELAVEVCVVLGEVTRQSSKEPSL